MSEYIKDSKQPSGWRTVSYEKKGNTGADGAPQTADNMDEGGGGEGSGGEEGPDC